MDTEQRQAAAQQRQPRSGTALFAVLLVVDLAFSFQQTAVIPAIPTVQRDLGASPEWAAWLLSAYLMVTTVATPAAARLADLRDRRTVLLGTLVLFLVGSVGASVAPNIGVLVLSRGVQGFGGAVFPLSLSLARQHLDEQRVPRAVALLTGAFGAGSAVGFGCGGVLAQYLSWRVIFAAGAVAIAVGAALVRLRVPRSWERARGSFDVPGTLLLGGAAVSLLLALTLGVQAGWVSWPVLALFVLAVGTGGWWVRWERHRQDPLVDLSLFRNRSVLLVNVASLGLGWAMFASFLLIPQLVQADPGKVGYGLAAGAAATGFLLMPSAILQALTSALGGAISDRVSPGRVLVGGLAVVAAAALVLAFTTQSAPVIVLGVALLGAGAGAAIEACSAVATSAVNRDVAAVSAAVNSTLRRFGGGVGSQVSTILLAASAVAGGAAHGAILLTFSIVAGMAVLGGVAGMFVPRGGGETRPARV